MSLPRLFAGLEDPGGLGRAAGRGRPGADPDASLGVDHHRALHGQPRRISAPALRAEIAAAGLRGRGGGGFPLARKLDVVGRRRARAGAGGPVVVANGCEGEPMSAKDRVLLRAAPHLVIDGAFVVADALGAARVEFAVDELDVVSERSLQRALDVHDVWPATGEVGVARIASGFVSGQEAALVDRLGGGEGRPRLAPPRVTERGLDGRPTLVSNVETLAHVALIAARGAGWFREVGTDEDPGSVLVTVSGAVAAPGVHEIDPGRSLAELVRAAGGVTGTPAGVLVGGYGGGWIGPDDLRGLRLDRVSLGRLGTRLGAGIVVVLAADVCPVAEIARTADWMAAQSAGQCGPCVHGLRAIADALADVRHGDDGRRALADVARWTGQVTGRGACAHPDGVATMVAGGLRVFSRDFLDHADHGPCDACDRPAVLATPALLTRSRRR